MTGRRPETALDIPAAWRRTAGRVAAKGWRKVLVIGAADRGKSTFCTYLARHLNLLPIPPSAAARRKSDRVRKRAREAAFLACFARAGTRELGLERLVVQRSLLFTGEAVADSRFLYAEPSLR